VSHASPIDDLVNRYRSSMTTRCDCGDEGCPGEVVPTDHNPRVIGMVLGAAVLVIQDLMEAGRSDEARALVIDCASYVRRCSHQFDDADFGLSEVDTERMLAGFYAEPVSP